LFRVCWCVCVCVCVWVCGAVCAYCIINLCVCNWEKNFDNNSVTEQANPQREKVY